MMQHVSSQLNVLNEMKHRPQSLTWHLAETLIGRGELFKKKLYLHLLKDLQMLLKHQTAFQLCRMPSQHF